MKRRLRIKDIKNHFCLTWTEQGGGGEEGIPMEPRVLGPTTFNWKASAQA